jgi:uncharacterized protein YjbJ (UPF0337 family)
MSIKGNFKEAKGYIKEELGEMRGDKKQAVEGRAERNVGRMMDGQAPKVTPVGGTK